MGRLAHAQVARPASPCAPTPPTTSKEAETRALPLHHDEAQDAQPTKHETEAKSATPASPRHQDLALTTTPNTQPHIEAMKEAPTNKPTPSYTAMPISRPQPHYNPTTARLRHHPTGPSHRHIVGPSRRHTGRGLVPSLYCEAMNKSSGWSMSAMYSWRHRPTVSAFLGHTRPMLAPSPKSHIGPSLPPYLAPFLVRHHKFPTRVPPVSVQWNPSTSSP